MLGTQNLRQSSSPLASRNQQLAQENAPSVGSICAVPRPADWLASTKSKA
jgi:hypothetical protein